MGELNAALLAPGDLPGNFTSAVLPPEVKDTSLAACPVLAENPAGVRYGAGVILTYQDARQEVVEALLQMDDNAAARGAIAEFDAVPANCPSFSGVIGGLTIQFTTRYLPDPPELGDQTVGLILTSTISIGGRTITADEDLVIIRRAGTLLTVATNGGAFDELISTAVDNAYAKLVAHE